MLENNELMSILFVPEEPVAPERGKGGSTPNHRLFALVASENFRPYEVDAPFLGN